MQITQPKQPTQLTQQTNKGNKDHMAESTFVPRRPCKHHMHQGNQYDQYVTP